MTNTDSDNEENRSIPSLVDSEDAPDGTSMYKYRDFSNVAEEELEQQPAPSSPPPSANSRGNVESSIRVQKFPVKLYAILAQKEFQDIITWMPHGRSWKVLKPNLFESLVMPLFFEYSNYHSFNRLVNAWSFRRISSGPDRGSYYHELFLRGKPQLQKYMRRLPKTHKKLPMKKEDEPDFYTMDKDSPLPSLDEAPLPQTAIMPQMRSQQQGAMGGGMGGPILPMQAMSTPSGMSSSGLSPTFDARDSLMSFNRSGMGVNGMGGMSGMGAMGGMSGMGSIGGVNSMGSISGVNSMGSINGMGSINSIGGISGMNTMNTMNGINALRESQFGGQSMGGLDGAFGGQGMEQFQRLRQIQQMRLLDRQMGVPSMAGLGNDTLASLRLNRQPC